MKPYRRQQPDAVEAQQITGGDFDDEHPNPHHIASVVYSPERRCAFIPTCVGLVAGHIGDWIIRDGAGKLQLYKQEVFARTYAPADNDLRKMINDLPEPVPNTRWNERYIAWWFENLAEIRRLRATAPPPDDIA